MSSTKKKTIKILLISIITIVGMLFMLNWFLTWKLQSYLRQELTQKVAEATGGFYEIDFEELNIGLFSGELEIEGVVLNPSTTVFKRWEQADRLPSTYFKVAIEKIYFKGINLTWRFNYKELNFDLFQIEQPFFSIYDSPDYVESREGTIKLHPQEIDLYTFISPYINVLTVKTLNLNNASINYWTRNKGQLSKYALEDVSFGASGFRLDSTSFYSGKLLYCQNFEFRTNKAQTFFKSNQFQLHSEKLELNTKDSIIQIDNISLSPQKDLWRQTNQVSYDYVEATVKKLKVGGIHFLRKNARNYLNARTFKIDNANFDYSKNIKAQKSKSLEGQKDSLDLSWTLYTMISPLLRSIEIDKVEVTDATLNYSADTPKGKDNYRLSQLNFGAYSFRIDSLADQQKKFLYSDGFDIEANNIQGTLTSKNHKFEIRYMYLSTPDSLLQVRDVKLKPLSEQKNLDYMLCEIDTISLNGLYAKKGIYTRDFIINNPKVKYVKKPLTPNRNNETEEDSLILPKPVASKSLDLITPFFGFLHIDRIYLKQGDIVFTDKRQKESITYKIPHIDFAATDVLVSKETIHNSDTYFTYDKLDFSFEQFDNLLFGKNYRLKIDKGSYDGFRGNLRLENVEVIPQKHAWKKILNQYVYFQSPLLNLKGAYYHKKNLKKRFGFQSFDIKSPFLHLTKIRNSKQEKKENELSEFDIQLAKINISDLNFMYEDKTQADTILIRTNQFMLDQFTWDAGKSLSINTLLVNNPKIKIHKSEKDKNTSKKEQKLSLPQTFQIGSIIINNAYIETSSPNLKLSIFNPKMEMKNWIWKDASFNLDYIHINGPRLAIHQILNSQKINFSESQSKPNLLYKELSKLSNKFRLGSFKIVEAQINYSQTADGILRNNQLVNSTNFDLTELQLDRAKEKLQVEDFNFSTRNLSFPLDKGYYTIDVEQLDIHKKDEMLVLHGLHLVPSYPKDLFAYKHPLHKDWFDVDVNHIVFKGMDYPSYFSSKILKIEDVEITNVRLQNFKNQKIKVAHHPMPMIYEGLQKLPVKLAIDTTRVRNFMIKYEELPKKGQDTSLIFFTEMNGTLTNLTNVVSREQQYIKLDADGKLMGSGHFTAQWFIPVDSLNDRFVLAADLNNFELKELNSLIEPMAPAKVNAGEVHNLRFKTEASSRGADVQMRLLYNNLNVTLYKKKDGELTPNKFVSDVINRVLKKDNPDKRKKHPREPYLYVNRNPYHSTFNYFWQILRPPLIESVGISQQKQNLFKQVGTFVSKVKSLFKRQKKIKSEDKPE